MFFSSSPCFRLRTRLEISEELAGEVAEIDCFVRCVESLWRPELEVIAGADEDDLLGDPRELALGLGQRDAALPVGAEASSRHAQRPQRQDALEQSQETGQSALGTRIPLFLFDPQEPAHYPFVVVYSGLELDLEHEFL